MTVLSSLSCTVTAAGVSKPAYADVYETLQSWFKAIYGSDAYVDPDSQDGQMLAIVARAVDDANDAAVAAYNSFSPATAQGAALSSNVKINGISRAVPTNSTTTLRITGTVGTVLNGCVASDVNGNRWVIPDGTTISPTGYIDVTAAAEQAGDVAALVGTVTGIATPTLGWQSVTNTDAATPGSAAESDAALRQRQAVSVALPSKTVLSGLKGQLLSLPGVTACEVYENDTNVTDANGLTAHSIAAVLIGGTIASIADVIMRKKTPGCSTLGTNVVGMTDLSGNPTTIRYYPATLKRMIAGVTVKNLGGYSSAYGDGIKAALAGYIKSLGIGRQVYIRRLDVPAQLYFVPGSGYDTFELTALQIAFFGNALGNSDLAIAFNEYADLQAADITLTVT